MNTFNAHDRAVESSPERQQLGAALSAQTTAQHEDRQARTELMQARSAPSHRMDSNHQQRLHRDRIAEAQQLADQRAHELTAAKGEADRLKRECHRLKLEGPRVEAHRHITARIIGAAQALQDAIADDQQFREQLVKDLLPFSSPLQSLGPWAWEGGGLRWIDGLRPVIEDWLKGMTKGDPYDLSKKPPATSATPQPALV